MLQGSGIRDWTGSLGLLPVPLLEADDRRFVLLNGGRGNFCLDLGGMEPAQPRSLAWSSDVGHYLEVVPAADRVKLFRWDKLVPDDLPLRDILADLEGFHAGLVRNEPSREKSVVSHVVRQFRSIRSALGTGRTGPECLRVFLYLLACAASDTDPRPVLDWDRWGVAPDAMDLAQSINDAQWASFVTGLREGRKSEGLQVVVPLVLRHAAGQLFQEAHYLAELPPMPPLLFEELQPAPSAVGSSDGSTGAYFTPSPLVRTVVEEALRMVQDQQHVTLFDPACGSGEFLREAVRQLRLRAFRGTVRVIGWDLSQAACDMTRFAIAWEAQSWGTRLTMEVMAGDALSRDWPTNVDFVLMNPPFLSWQDMTEAQRTNVQESMGALASRRPDLASVFVLRAADCLGPTGTLGSVIPASFLEGHSLAGLRVELASRLKLTLVARLGSQAVFSRAMVDAGLFVATKAASPVDEFAVWADFRPDSMPRALRSLRRLRSPGQEEAVEADGFSVYRSEVGSGGGTEWAPRPRASHLLLKALEGLPRVADTFDVRQGVLTGYNAAFVLPKGQLDGLPEEERGFFRPAVVNESIHQNRLEDVAYVFYPYSSDGRPMLAEEKDLRRRLPTYFRTILSFHLQALMGRARVQASEWWRLSEKRAWQALPQPRLATKYFGSSGAFVHDHTGKFVVVQGYAWNPKRPAAFDEAMFLAYLALLACPKTDQLLAGVSVQVGGGQWNLSKRYVDAMPLPSPDMLQKGGLVRELAEIGVALRDGCPVDAPLHKRLVDAAHGGA